APMDAAAEIAARFDVDFLPPVPAPTDAGTDRFVFGPVDAGIARMWVALEVGEPDQAVGIAQDIHPERHPLPVNRAHYWMHYGRALAALRGHGDDAVRALRTAEDVFPTAVRRNPIVREVIATLLSGARQDAIGMELRGLAHRAGVGWVALQGRGNWLIGYHGAAEEHS
ncbi:MAG: hypothetical protein LC775_19895, partial [Acidobacteria bacterium]|nr:hypothetical protein [Acidobacteriota bacterium]